MMFSCAQLPDPKGITCKKKINCLKVRKVRNVNPLNHGYDAKWPSKWGNSQFPTQVVLSHGRFLSHTGIPRSPYGLTYTKAWSSMMTGWCKELPCKTSDSPINDYMYILIHISLWIQTLSEKVQDTPQIIPQTLSKKVPGSIGYVYIYITIYVYIQYIYIQYIYIYIYSIYIYIYSIYTYTLI